MKNIKKFVIILLAMTMLVNPVNAEAKTKSKATVKKIKANNDNSLKIKLKVKKSKKIKGYQIRYSTKKNMKDAVKITTKRKTIKPARLEKETTYYVQVRDIKVVKGKKVYSKWSPKKQVKTKSRIKNIKLNINYKDGSKSKVNINPKGNGSCSHKWVEKYETKENCYWKEVLVKEGYYIQRPITESGEVHICSTCNQDITNESKSQHLKMHMMEDPLNAKGWYCKPIRIVVGYKDVYIEPEYDLIWTVETEEVLVGYECSKCHCIK